MLLASSSFLYIELAAMSYIEERIKSIISSYLLCSVIIYLAMHVMQTFVYLHPT